MGDPLHDDALEHDLMRLPQPELSDAARERIGAAIRVAEQRRMPWWSRPVARWQLAAACILTGVVGFGVARYSMAPRVEPSVTPPVVRMMTVRQSLFRNASADPVRRLNIARWAQSDS